MRLKAADWPRIYTLTVLVVAFAILLAARYGRRQDTVTFEILTNALSSPPGTDSTFYMTMGETAFRSGDHRIYQQLFFVRHEKFIYPPSSLFLLEGLNDLGSLHISPAAVWMALLLIGWAGAVLTGVLLYRSQGPQARALELVCVAVLGILFLPFAEALYRGQVQILLTFLWGVSILLWQRGRTAWSGFALAVTCIFKPQLAVFLLWGVLRRKWRFSAAFAGTTAAILICSIAHFGWRNHTDYLAVLSYLDRHGEALWANQSVNGIVNRLLRNGDASSWNPTVYPPYRPIVFVLSSCFSALCLVAGLLLPKLLGWASTTADFVFFGCLSVLMSPIAWEHHYGYFFFAIVLLIARAERLSRTQWVVLTLSLLAMANRLPKLDSHVGGVSSLLGDYLFVAGLATLALLTLQWRSASLATRHEGSELRSNAG